jgi:urease accessory protein
MKDNVETLGAAPTTTDAGWLASLEMKICRRGDKSVVSKSSQTGPLTIQSPFYPEGDLCHLYLLHPPSGIVGGDCLQLNVSVYDQGAALITTPGATKFYRTNGKVAHQRQQFNIDSGASFEWLPQETIYFPDAYAHLNTVIHLEHGSRFLGWDIHCLGLPANDLDFGGGNAKIGLQIYRENVPIFIDMMHVTKEKREHQAAFLRDYPITATFVATDADPELLEQVRTALPLSRNGQWAVTLVADLLVLRYLGASGHEARKLFINAWKLARPHILERDVVLPRIWAT